MPSCGMNYSGSSVCPMLVPMRAWPYDRSTSGKQDKDGVKELCVSEFLQILIHSLLHC